MCISGQSIRNATERIKRYPYTENMKIISNLGAVDILHGRELSDVCQDYVNFIKICDHRGIKAVITTIPPLANRLHSQDEQTRHELNYFLKKRFSQTHLVIDIEPCMVCSESGKVLFDCYQP